MYNNNLKRNSYLLTSYCFENVIQFHVFFSSTAMKPSAILQTHIKHITSLWPNINIQVLEDFIVHPLITTWNFFFIEGMLISLTAGIGYTHQNKKETKSEFFHQLLVDILTQDDPVSYNGMLSTTLGGRFHSIYFYFPKLSSPWQMGLRKMKVRSKIVEITETVRKTWAGLFSIL